MWKLFSFMALMALSLLIAACSGGNSSSSPPQLPRYSISGTILADSATSVDSDINDPQTTPVSNDSFDTPQNLPVPVVLGGYLNQPNSGQPGNSFSSGDQVDIFLVSFQGSETIRIALPDKAAANTDFSLSLYAQDNTDTAVRSVASVGQTASITAPAQAGDYYIKIQALSGAGSYRLMVAQPGSTILRAESAQEAEFVPGQILVKFNSNAGRSMTASQDNGIPGLDVVDRQAGDWMRLKLVDRQAAFERLNIAPEPDAARGLNGSPLPNDLKQDTLRVIRALNRLPGVQWAEPNYIRRPFFEPDDPLFALQWHYQLINLPEAWDLTTGSDQVIVAVVDSGVLLDHPDLQGKLVSGYDFVSDPATSNDEDGIDTDPDDPGDGADGGSTFHGTHIAGTVAAQTHNNLGVAGAGYNTRIMPVRVLGLDGGNDADIAKGIRWAAGLEVQDGQGQIINPPARRADIINMSFGSTGELSKTLQSALAAARAAGVILVAAAGNEASDTLTYPAASPDVVAVGAVDINGRRAAYSNFGSLDVVAPGGNTSVDLNRDGYADGILSTAGSDADGSPPDLIYAYLQGTSMACAHVAGVAALMKSVRPDLTPDEFLAYLQSGQITLDLGSSVYYGNGLIDACLAVSAASSSDPPAVLTVTPRSLQLDISQNTANISVRKLGSGELTLAPPVADADWLSIDYMDNQSDSLGKYQVRADLNSNSLKNGGFHTGTITFTTSANSIQVTVSIQMLPDPAADAGLQYILLVDADNSGDPYQLIRSADNGRYTFSFTDIPAGNYYLVSGSDLDNDRYILQQGEAGGGYPSLADSQPIVLQGDLSDIQFTVGFAQIPFFEPQWAGPASAAKRNVP